MPTRRLLPFLAAAWVIASCDSGAKPADPPDAEAAAPPGPPAAVPPTAKAAPAEMWKLQSADEGTALALLESDGGTVVRFFCPSGKKRLLLNVPGFRPIGSEERLSFGSGGAVTALVADTGGDAQRGGVSGTGDVPDDLAALIGGTLSVSYGAQTSGPHPAPPQADVRAFVAGCSTGAAAAAPPPPAPAGPCRMQGSERLVRAGLKAVGTEPFWAARIEGRCVTYSHPEDQKGTRLWTRYAKGAAEEVWSGALGGRSFELRVRPQPGCSDGMSDKRYPLAVDLTVNGEKRSGCAEPA